MPLPNLKKISACDENHLRRVKTVFQWLQIIEDIYRFKEIFQIRNIQAQKYGFSEEEEPTSSSRCIQLSHYQLQKNHTTVIASYQDILHDGFSHTQAFAIGETELESVRSCCVSRWHW